jgi:hypothetical protein
MRDLEPLDVDEEEARAVRHGMTFPASTRPHLGPGPFAILDGHGELLAVYERRKGAIKAAVVVADVSAGT